MGDKRDKHVKKPLHKRRLVKKCQNNSLANRQYDGNDCKGGERKEVRIADKVMYQNGTTMLSFQNKRPDGDSIDRYTAQTLQKYLRQVVTSDKGTGRRFQDLPFHIAGNQALPKPAAKINRESTLSQVVCRILSGRKPKYALVVVHLDEASGRAKTNEAFYDIVKRSMKLKRNRHRTSLHVMLE